MTETRYRPSVELYEHLKNCGYGDEFTYDELGSILGEDPQGKGRAAILTVRRWLLVRNDKLLLCRIGKGYYIGHPNEHLDYSVSQEESGEKKTHRALLATVHVNMGELEDGEKKLLLEQQLKLGIELSIRTHMNRQKELTVDVEAKLPTPSELLSIALKKIGKE